jgi:hypothetical protein
MANMTEPTQAESETATNLERAGQVFGSVILALLAAGIVFAIIGIYPHKIPAARNPSFVDNIFASRIVILAMRIALLFAAAYVAVSVVGLVANRRWIAELGPFKASEPLARLDESAAAMESDLAEALGTIGELSNDCRRAMRRSPKQTHLSAHCLTTSMRWKARKRGTKCRPRTARSSRTISRRSIGRWSRTVQRLILLGQSQANTAGR